MKGEGGRARGEEGLAGEVMWESVLVYLEGGKRRHLEGK